MPELWEDVAEENIDYYTSYRPHVEKMSAPDHAKKKSACFIAEAAHGTLLEPRLDSIRRFRDKAMPAWQVRLYYDWLSPPIARFIAEHPAAKQLVRALVWPLVVLLDHPYETTVFVVVPLLALALFYLFAL